jgi:hypothetical protein
MVSPALQFGTGCNPGRQSSTRLNNRCAGAAVFVGEGGEHMMISRKMLWIGGGLVALAVLIVVLILVYSGGGSGGSGY